MIFNFEVLMKKYIGPRLISIMIFVVVLAGCMPQTHIYKSGQVYNTRDSVLLLNPSALILVESENGNPSEDKASMKKIEKYLKDFVESNLYIPRKVCKFEPQELDSIKYLVNSAAFWIAEHKTIEGAKIYPYFYKLMEKYKVDYLMAFALHGMKEQKGTEYDFSKVYCMVIDAKNKNFIYFGEYIQNNVDLNVKMNFEKPLIKLIEEFLKDIQY